jgi:hypothetical protein
MMPFSLVDGFQPAAFIFRVDKTEEWAERSRLLFGRFSLRISTEILAILAETSVVLVSTSRKIPK